MLELQFLRVLLLLMCLTKALGNNTTLETMSMDDTCAIGAYNVEFLSPILDENTPGDVTLPLYTVFGEVSPSAAASRARFETRCRYNGKDIPITNRRTINGLDMYDCVVQMKGNNCEDNVVIITGRVEIPDSKGMPECSRATRRVVSYCNGELKKDVEDISAISENDTDEKAVPPLKPSPNNPMQTEKLQDDEPCNVGDFDLEIKQPKPDPENPLSVTFPCIAAHTVSEAAKETRYDFRCTYGLPGQLTSGVVKNRRNVEGGVSFDCQFLFTNAQDCDWNVVHIEGKVSVGKTNKCVQQKVVKTTYCTEPNETCSIEGFEIQILEPRPNSNDPHSVTFPCLAVYSGAEIDGQHTEPDVDFRCTTGMPGQLAAGVIKNERKVDDGYLFECDVRFNNTQDCEWNLLTVDGKASLESNDGRTCESRNVTKTNYCTDAPPEPTPCQSANLTLDIGDAQLGDDDVAFPVSLKLDGVARSDLDSVEFECTIGGRAEKTKRGAVEIQEPFDKPYEVEFSCSLDTAEIYECEEVSVTVTGIFDDECERNVTETIGFCPETCTIDDFSVSIRDVSPGFLPNTVVATIWVETDMEPEELEESIVAIDCGMSGKAGQPESVDRVAGGFKATCTVSVEDKFDCDQNLLEATATIKKERSDGGTLCWERKKTILHYCAEKPTGCLLDAFDIKVLKAKDIKSDFFETKGVATVQVTYKGNKKVLSKLGFVNWCSSGGHKGETRIVAKAVDGYLFECVFHVRSVFESLENNVELRATAHLQPQFHTYHQDCTQQTVEAVHHLCLKPQCVLYPVGMAYEAKWGPVTDESHASFVLTCTHPTLFCEDCFYLVGPRDPGLIEVEKISGTNKAYHVTAEWEYGYQGKVTLGIQTGRTLGGCDIRAEDIERLTKRFPNCAVDILDSVDIISDVTFYALRARSVGVKTLGYKLGSKCTKGHPPKY